MSKFNVGDKVKVVRDEDTRRAVDNKGQWLLGQVGEVICSANPHEVIVELSAGGGRQSFLPQELQGIREGN
ncbi:hypothetical protein [Mycobacterium persicum]|uniref:hypothetical protein n=1 Tax=Mycobacterium persicum TaxID=1487726 RepID=UPI0009F5D0CE|nr:hypothetical protein [Mycobacterium persicum]ORB53677.1 hypothetical protein BST40_07655 [Mycobacterium persicum]